MTLIKNAHIKTMSGHDIENGCILLGNDGKIAAVSKSIDVDSSVDIVDAGGRLLTPGCVEPHCHIGIHGTALRWEGHDVNELVDPVTPHLRAIDAIDPMDEAFSDAVKYGVTTALTGPGSGNVLGGSFVALKLHGKRLDDMIIKYPAAMKCAFGENPKESPGGRSPKTRMATAWAFQCSPSQSRRSPSQCRATARRAEVLCSAT